MQIWNWFNIFAVISGISCVHPLGGGLELKDLLFRSPCSWCVWLFVSFISKRRRKIDRMFCFLWLPSNSMLYTPPRMQFEASDLKCSCTNRNSVPTLRWWTFMALLRFFFFFNSCSETCGTCHVVQSASLDSQILWFFAYMRLWQLTSENIHTPQTKPTNNLFFYVLSKHGTQKCWNLSLKANCNRTVPTKTSSPKNGGKYAQSTQGTTNKYTHTPAHFHPHQRVISNHVRRQAALNNWRFMWRSLIWPHWSINYSKSMCSRALQGIQRLKGVLQIINRTDFYSTFFCN